MPVRDDLESELHDKLEDPTLAIYADHLQALGDPRGELIALDLHGVSPTDDRRGELLASWLGDGVTVWRDEVESVWYAGDPDHTFATFDRGFMAIVVGGDDEDPPIEAFAALLASRAGPYLRRLFVGGRVPLVRSAIAELAAAARPWLRDLAIRDERRLDIPTDRVAALREPMIDAALHDALCAATPRLERLDVTGRRTFHALAHPAVRELAILGEEAIGLPDGPAMPNVTSIDLAFDPDHDIGPGALERLIAPGRFPGLRQLKLAREEPGERALFPRLGELAVAAQLTHLVLPALRSRHDVEHVQAAIDRLPSLHVVELARVYHVFGGVERHLAHRSARIRIPVVSPWVPFDMLEYGRILRIETHDVRVETLVDLMEVQYAAMPEIVRDAWDRFWHLVANLGWQTQAFGGRGAEELPAAVMLAALDGLVHPDELALAALRRELAQIVDTGSYRPIHIRWR